MIVAARDAERPQRVGRELGALPPPSMPPGSNSSGGSLMGFHADRSHSGDGTRPYYAPLAEIDVEKARRDIEGAPRTTTF